jgi:hypothetical protein
VIKYGLAKAPWSRSLDGADVEAIVYGVGSAWTTALLRAH